MATSTEKQDHVGRAVAQVRDNFRNLKKRGVCNDMEFWFVKSALNEAKEKVRKFEEEERAYWASLFATEPAEEDAA